MNARDQLLGTLVKLHGWNPNEANMLIDAFAHELAEQQRQHVRQQAANPLHYGSATWAIKGVDEGADLIDPQAQRTAASKEQQ